MGNSFIQTSNLAQFNNLIHELMQGGPKRTVFQKWEVDLLLDFGTCRMRQSARSEILPALPAHGATIFSARPVRLSSSVVVPR